MRHFVIALLASFVSVVFVVDDAQAKRLGGGQSFGSKPSYSQPAQRSADQPNQNAPQQPASTQAAPAAGGGATAARPGMGGLFGGLLAGSLLGALFFGGAFENIGIVDILILGLLGFLAYRFFAARRRHAAQQPAAAGGVPLPPDEPTYGRPTTRSGQPRADLSGSSVRGAAVTLPQGFDAAEFLRGAEAAYRRLQAAWDSGELADLREFTTDAVFGELQDQYRARKGENTTEVQSLRSYLQGVTETEDQLEARVLFVATLVERDATSALMVDPTEVEEVWYFVKPKRSPRPTWFLDGIQQSEAI